MKRHPESGYGGFPAVLLTFSLLLLVLAIGFVVGRVVVARAYLDKAPRFDVRAPGASDVPSELERRGSAPAGRVYVPPPAPPAEPPSEGVALEAERSEDEYRWPSESTSPEGVPRRSAERDTRAEAPTPPPAPARGPEPDERAAEPAPTPRQREDTEQRTYAIQVGVFTSLQGARRVVDELARAGYPARIVPEKRGAEDLYRVMTGRYRSEYAARKAVGQLRKEGFEAFLIQQ